MAFCTNCKLDMQKADGCIGVPVIIQGVDHDPIPNHREVVCGDCKAAPGKFHHPGCDNERCPVCRGQLISCGCLED